MRLNAIIGLMFLVIPFKLFASNDQQIALQFERQLTSVEECLLNTLVDQTPFSVKHIEVNGPLAFGDNKRRVELPILMVTETNHPALVTLYFVSGIEHQWGKITTGGRPIFVTAAMESTIDVHDTTTREKAYSISQTCIENAIES